MGKHYARAKQKNTWQIQEAKAKFSRVIGEACEAGYQTITKKGVPIAIIISKNEFDRMAKPKQSLLNFFKSSPCPEVDLKIERSKDLPREFDL